MWVTEPPRKLNAGEWAFGAGLGTLVCLDAVAMVLLGSHFFHEHLQVSWIPDLLPLEPEELANKDGAEFARNFLLGLAFVTFLPSLVGLDDLRKTRKGLPVWMPYGQ